MASPGNLSSSPLSSPPDSDVEDNPASPESPTFGPVKQLGSIHISSPVARLSCASLSPQQHAGPAPNVAPEDSNPPPDVTTEDDEPPLKKRMRTRSKVKAEVGLPLESAAESKPVPPPKATPKSKPRPKKSKWDIDTVLIDPKSPLADVDIRSMLCHPSAWDVLSLEEKTEILNLFPDRELILGAGTEEMRPDIAALQNNDDFRNDCSRYREHLADGKHDPEWLAQAWEAHERRMIGEFDDFLDKKFVETWGVEIPDELRPKRPKKADTPGADDREVESEKVEATDGETSGQLDKEKISQENGKEEKAPAMSTSTYTSALLVPTREAVEEAAQKLKLSNKENGLGSHQFEAEGNSSIATGKESDIIMDGS